MESDSKTDLASNQDEMGCALDGPAGSFSSTAISLKPSLDFPADDKLVAEGWQRRFMADPVRLQEATALYTELGYEVRAETIQPNEMSSVCGSCRIATCQAYVTIYTRKRARSA